MAKPRNSRPRGKTDPQKKFFQMFRWMFDCQAYRSLSLCSRCLLDELLMRHDGRNNGNVLFGHREAAERLNVNRRTVAKAFTELEEKGFIKMRQRGSFTLKVRHATRWELTHEPCNDREATKEFARWLPPENRTRVHPVHPTGAPSTPVVDLATVRKVRK